MKIVNRHWTADEGWSGSFPQEFLENAQLVFIFGSRQSICGQNIYSQLRQEFPTSTLIGCSTSGEILNDSQVLDDSLVVTAIVFEHSHVDYCVLPSSDFETSYHWASSWLPGFLKKAWFTPFFCPMG
jgi:hypothetical protein